jgi:hypothetical protein
VWKVTEDLSEDFIGDATDRGTENLSLRELHLESLDAIDEILVLIIEPVELFLNRIICWSRIKSCRIRPVAILSPTAYLWVLQVVLKAQAVESVLRHRAKRVDVEHRRRRVGRKGGVGKLFGISRDCENSDIYDSSGSTLISKFIQ